MIIGMLLLTIIGCLKGFQKGLNSFS
jgi:hypothetical protein